MSQISKVSPRALVAALRRANRLPDDLVPRFEDLERRATEAINEVRRLSPQVAALEARLEDLREAFGTPGTGALSVEDADTARGILDEVHAEHARVRARISAAVVFEERLRVLEAKAGVDSTTGRDLPPAG